MRKPMFARPYHSFSLTAQSIFQPAELAGATSIFHYEASPDAPDERELIDQSSGATLTLSLEDNSNRRTPTRVPAPPEKYPDPPSPDVLPPTRWTGVSESWSCRPLSCSRLYRSLKFSRLEGENYVLVLV